MDELLNKNTMRILKGILALALVSALVFSIVPNVIRTESLTTRAVITGKTTEPETTLPPVSEEVVTEKRYKEYKINPKISAPNAIVYNLTNNYISYDKNSSAKIHPASLSKLLTAVVALKYVSPKTVFTVGSELSLVPKGASTCLIKEGHKISLSGLLAGMLLASGNDAAYTIAVNVAKIQSKNNELSDSEAVKYFVNLMNVEAIYIGAKNSNFTSPDGWDDENQYTTVFDLLLIAKRAMEEKEIASLVSQKEKYVLFDSGENVTWKNTNGLQNVNSGYYLSASKGIKAGMSTKAGRCIISLFAVENEEYIAVACAGKTDGERYGAIKTFYDELSKIQIKATESSDQVN